MPKAKGRFAQEKHLADMTVEPPEDEVWTPPHDVVHEEYPIVFDDDNRLIVRTAYDGPQLADFCLALQKRVEGKWLEVVRCDCAHGTIHQHHFRVNGSLDRRRELRKIRDYRDVRQGFDERYEVLVERWNDYSRTFS